MLEMEQKNERAMNFDDLIPDLIEKYKADFQKIDSDERYKWEAIKCYKDNWDIKAPDFSAMLEKAFAKTFNLLAAGQYFPLRMLKIAAASYPEEVRSLFEMLYDESLPLDERFDLFRAGFAELVDQEDSHYQDLHAISIYLTFQYPEKYYIYKYNVWSEYLKYFGKKTPSLRGKHETYKIQHSNELCDNILSYVIDDEELCAMSRTRLDENCYSDPTYRMLAFDIMYFGSRQAGGWWPSLEEFDPKLSKEEWKKYITEIEMPDHPSPMQMLKALMQLGGEASCKRLAIEFGGTVSAYVGCAVNLGRRVKEHFNLPPCMDGDQERYFPFPFFGKGFELEDGHQYVYKIRPELYAALKEIDLSDVALHYDAKNEEAEGIAREEETVPAIQPYTKADFLNEVYIDEDKYNTCVSRLQHKKNLILQGAPGVGKTFAAKRLAYSVMGCKDDSRVQMVQFHQSYSYEDFIMGYKPSGNGFSLEDGIFYKFCNDAKNDPEQKYFFIIDEINRGNMSKIFGELLMLIEDDYRGKPITLAYNKQEFFVPENLYIIGMMNTADRSLAMIDYALRRRFSFIEMTPGFDSERFKEYQQTIKNDKFAKLINQIVALNEEITKDASLGKGFCIGHSYFCKAEVNCSDAYLKEIVEYEIIPMLEEYWFDDAEKVKRFSNDLRGVFDGKQ